MRTKRATQAEKAEAWDRLMASTNPTDADAILDAWEWLDKAVGKREAETNAQENAES